MVAKTLGKETIPEVPITECQIDMDYGLETVYNFSYLPSYRDRVILDIMKKNSCNENSPEVQQAVFNYIRKCIEDYPTILLEKQQLSTTVIEYRQGYADCLKQHGLPNPSQPVRSELQIKV